MFVVKKNVVRPVEGGKLIAAVDLGSNSFHLMVARVVLKDNDFRLTHIFFFYEIVLPFVHVPKWRCELDGI